MKRPGMAKRALLNTFYEEWVQRMKNNENTIIAVQTMRNLIMSVTFLSSSILILLGLLVQSNLPSSDGIVQISLTSTSLLNQYKLFTLFIILVFSLIMFLLSLRHMVRFSIIIGIPNEAIEKTGTEEIKKQRETEHVLNADVVQSAVFLKAMNRFMFGIRGVYFAVTLLVWFINVYAFIVSTIALTIILIHYHDIRTPNLDVTPI
jgi:uncharacterized membrane protein